MEWTEKTVKELQKIMYQYNMQSLDELINLEDGEEGATVVDLIGNDDVQEQLDIKLTNEMLMKYVSKLRPREHLVIALRFGLTDEKPKTLEEVGEVFGITRERARQIECKALLHLRRLLQKDGINSRADI